MRSRDRLKATVENLAQAMADGELTTAQAVAELGSYLLVFLNMYPVSYDEIAKTDLLFTLAEVMKTIELEAKVH